MTPGSRPRTRPATGRDATVPVHERFAERAGHQRRRPQRLMVWTSVVLALVTAVAAVLLWSPAFVVEKVSVVGVEGSFVESAAADAAIPLEQPLARVDTEAAAVRVERDVRVGDATVVRDWPSQITVRVSLRQPAIAIRRAGTTTYDVADADGVVFGTAAEPPKGVPVVRVPGGDIPPGGLQAALALVQSLPADIGDRLSAVRLAPDGDLRFSLGAVQVRWGSGQDAELKGQVLQALLKQEQVDPGGEQAITIDLAVPQTPAVTGLTPSPGG